MKYLLVVPVLLVSSASFAGIALLGGARDHASLWYWAIVGLGIAAIGEAYFMIDSPAKSSGRTRD